jgi:cytochrome bd ubiquinol oxidase subunit I
MDVELLARIQFAVTAGFHFLYPPMSIGLGLVLVFMKGMFLKTNDPLYDKLTKFWTKIFALTFSIGVVTGIVLEFEFGTNWSQYSRMVGDIFGSPLAAEALFAFFMESLFLGILLFGWNKVGPKMHFFSTVMVALGATLSAFFIIVANSWMQTPAGYKLITEIKDGITVVSRAEITDFWAMVFNPSTIERYIHVIGAAWMTGAFFVLGISGWYILKNKHLDYAKASIKIALPIAIFASLFQVFTGHASAIGVTHNQPAKLAAFEGHYNTGPGTMWLFGYVDESSKEVKGIGIPGMLSFLVDFNSQTPIKGLNDFKPEDSPPVQLTFQSYHLMVALAMAMVAVVLISLFFWWRGNLFNQKWLMALYIPLIFFPHISNIMGWIAAEVGRQPWVVQGILRTKDAISKVVTAEQVWFSLLMFTLIYVILLVLFVYLLLRKIKQGPEDNNNPVNV